ncbi:membrane protein [Gordonia phage Shivanishola]|nr:membrane protein [Gordonia phage Shivanishola]
MRKVGLTLLPIGLGVLAIGVIVAGMGVSVQGGAISCGHPLYRDNVFSAIEPCRDVMRDRAILMWSLFAVAAPILSASFVTLFLSSERRNEAIRTADLEAFVISYRTCWGGNCSI